MKNKKNKNLAVLVEQQARQIITLEKKLYDTRDKLNKQVEGLESLRHLTEKILSSTSNVEEISNDIIEYLIYEMEIEKALLFLSQNEKGLLKLQAVGGYRKEEIKELESLNFKIEGLLEEIIKERGVRIFNIEPKDTQAPPIKEFIERLKLSYFLSAPLTGRGGGIIGVLVAGYSREKVLLILPQFTEEDIVLFLALVGQSSLFIENAETNIELQRRIRELEKFSRITVGRELKMTELKKEIKRLKEELEKEKT